jgi:orotate phosphoribosyltransferase
MKSLTGRLRDIASGATRLPAEAVAAYRQKFVEMGYEISALPESPANEPAPSRQSPQRGGPGTELKTLIDSLQIAEAAGCSCGVLRAEMDTLGVEGCQRHRERLIHKIRESSTRVSWLSRLKAVGPAVWSGLAFVVNPFDPIPGLFDEAVRRAQEKEAAQPSHPEPPSRPPKCGRCGGSPKKRATVYAPFRPAAETPQFISASQLMEDAKALAARLPADTSMIIGVARSGLPVATMVSMLLHRPLWIVRQSFRDIVPAGNGWRLTGSIESSGPPVVIDDTVMTGNSLKQLMPIVRKSHPNALFSAVYVNPASRVKPDLWVRDLPWPHLLEWNLFNSVLSPHMAVDFDGILCDDCPPADDDDGERYLRFLKDTPPRYVMRRVPIGLVVTARLEKYRRETEEWLARYGVQVKKLVMGPWETKVERSGASISEFKAQHFAEFLRQPHSIKPPMFVESDARQAEQIAKLSGGLVVCPAAGRCFGTVTLPSQERGRAA